MKSEDDGTRPALGEQHCPDTKAINKDTKGRLY